jgi:hypothetical protein
MMAGPAPDKVRSAIGDREFLAEVFVELFEGTEAQPSIAASSDGLPPRRRALAGTRCSPRRPRRGGQPRVREHDESV